MTARDGVFDDVRIPLVVDLDGALLQTDTLHEALIGLLRIDPWLMLRLPFWLTLNRAALKRSVAERSLIDVETLPMREDLIRWLESEYTRGRRILVATAADQKIADAVAARFPFISEVIASDGVTNLKGGEKARALIGRFPDGFVYIGDSWADLEVWRIAAGCVTAGASPKVLRAVQAIAKPLKVFPAAKHTPAVYRRALRAHQWAKNVLVFVPLVLGNAVAESAAWIDTAIAFMAICLLTSSTYLLNDLWDLPEDRRHWSKRHRPVATGELPITDAVILAAAGILAAFALGAYVSRAAAAVLALYSVLSLAYSFRLKREPIVDVAVLATLFTLRLGLGIVTSRVPFSSWLLVFSMFVFSSLALAKRTTEIERSRVHASKESFGRGYHLEDSLAVAGFGIAAAACAVLIMVIYLISDAMPASFYGRPTFLWGLPVVLFLWLGRVWILCNRGELHDDPVAFALKDRISLFYATVFMIVFIIAIW